jgi:hypothetical protein
MGIKAICNGTTSKATTMMKNTLRPGNFIQAKPYAAKAAIRIGMMVAGTVTVILFRKARPRLSPLASMTLPSESTKLTSFPSNTWR